MAHPLESDAIQLDQLGSKRKSRPLPDFRSTQNRHEATTAPRPFRAMRRLMHCTTFEK